MKSQRRKLSDEPHRVRMIARAASRMSAMTVGFVLLVCGCGRTPLDVPIEEEECTVETATLQVPSTVSWFDTGIDVVAGQRLRMITTGSVRYGPKPEQVTDADGGHYSGKKFFSAAVLPNSMVCSLTGKIGGTTEIGTGTLLPEGLPSNGAGFVGAFYDEIVPEGGRLFLGFNDQKNAFGDNIGAFTVTIMFFC